MVIILIVVALAIILILGGIVTYNGLVRLRNQADNGWSQIDVQLKRRSDLIPNLVETVKGYASHERATLEAVIQARGAGLSATTPGAAAAADNVLTGALRQLFALSESYPNLKADANFRQLQEELTATEDRVAYARQFYNDAVTRYNTKTQTFPANMIAGMGNFARKELFEASDFERVAPTVKF